MYTRIMISAHYLQSYGSHVYYIIADPFSHNTQAYKIYIHLNLRAVFAIDRNMCGKTINFFVQ